MDSKEWEQREVTLACCTQVGPGLQGLCLYIRGAGSLSKLLKQECGVVRFLFFSKIPSALGESGLENANCKDGEDHKKGDHGGSLNTRPGWMEGSGGGW